MCLSRLPFFGLVLQRLHSFSTEVIDRKGCVKQLVALAGDLRETRFEQLGHSAVYQVREKHVCGVIRGFSLVWFGLVWCASLRFASLRFSWVRFALVCILV